MSDMWNIDKPLRNTGSQLVRAVTKVIAIKKRKKKKKKEIDKQPCNEEIHCKK